MTEPDAEAKDQIQILRPDWDIPGVDAGFTLRTGGVSKPPYDSLNLAMHVGDDPDDVRENRRRLVEYAGLPEEPRWLKQVHGNRVVHASEVERDITEADAVWTDQPGQVCAVMAADCVPILLAAKDGRCVAAIHAGWRGLAAGVIEETLACMSCFDSTKVGFLGPSIHINRYPVGREVVKQLENKMVLNGKRTEHTYKEYGNKSYVSLAGVSTQILQRNNVREWCEYTDIKSLDAYYSFRNEKVTGRNCAYILKVERS